MKVYIGDIVPVNSSEEVFRYLERVRTANATGAPTRAVTELMGRAPSNPGRRAMRLHTRASEAPQSIVAGRSTRWSSILKSPRLMWGTARPMNMIGPQ